MPDYWEIFKDKKALLAHDSAGQESKDGMVVSDKDSCESGGIQRFIASLTQVLVLVK